MDNLLKVYSDFQDILKHKDELLKQPEILQEILESLKKASGSDKYTRDWQPNPSYTDKQKELIDQHMKDGYSHREAERLAGAHKTPSDFVSALKSGIAPSTMSERMMSQLKPLAREWIENADKQEKLRADPEKNTVKRQAGMMTQAHEKSTANFTKDYNNFLSSDEVKGLKGKDRHAAVTKWKADWKSANPEHNEGLAGVSDVQNKFAFDQSKAREETKNKVSEVATGKAMPTDMSEKEAMQHLGGGKTEEGYAGTIVHDPSVGFAQRNPQLAASLKPEQQERLNLVDSAAKSQGKVRVRKGPQNAN